MRWLLALALLIGGVASARAQSMTDMGWVVCSVYGGQYCNGAWKGSRNATGSTESMTKRRPAASKVKGPYYVAPDELAWHCYGTGRWGCAVTRASTCWIFIDRTLSAENKRTVVAHERRHCAGFTHR
jgi:hypothetical protein